MLDVGHLAWVVELERYVCGLVSAMTCFSLVEHVCMMLGTTGPMTYAV